MKTDLKAAWVQALRSGDYAQGTGQLHDPNRDCHCALGVLGQLLAEDGEARWSADGTELFPLHFPFDPDEFISARLTGLTPEEQGDIVHLNDTQRRSFAEIADWIEGAL